MSLRTPVLLLVAGGLAASLLLFAALRRWERQQVESEFDRKAQAAAQAVTAGVRASLDVVRALQAFYQASDSVSEAEALAFLTPLLDRHPEIESLTWTSEAPAGGDFRYTLPAKGGFVSAAFRVERLLGVALPEGICLSVTGEGRSLFRSAPSPPDPAGPRRQGSLGLGGRTWRFLLYPTPAFLAHERRWYSAVALAAGLLLTALLALYLRAALTRAERVERLVAERSEDLKRSEERWQFALEGSGDGVWDWNLLNDRVFFSDRWKALLGYAPKEIPDEFSAWSMRVHPDDLTAVEVAMDRHFRGETKEYGSEFRMQAKDGSWRWILARGKVMAWTPEGKPLRMVGTHSDITDRKRLEEALAHRATHDVLTGLPNRALWQEFLAKALARSRRDGRKVAVLFLDLDGFKKVNDTLGHDAGDALLKEVAKAASSCLRDSDLVGRLGGDEFVVALPDLERREDAERVGGKILAALNEARIGASLGLSLFPEDAEDPEGLLRRADEAMYRAKQARRHLPFSAAGGA